MLLQYLTLCGFDRKVGTGNSAEDWRREFHKKNIPLTYGIGENDIQAN
jgi:hypothetical protein